MMRKKGGLVEYIDKYGNWVENVNLLRMFIGLDTRFYEISEAEADVIVRKKGQSPGITGNIWISLKLLVRD